MSEINKKHDTFFRETMSHKEVAADFLANYLPAKVLEHIRLDTLTITKDSFVKGVKSALGSHAFFFQQNHPHATLPNRPHLPIFTFRVKRDM